MTESALSPELRIPCRRKQPTDRRKSHFRATIHSFFGNRRQELRRDAGTLVSEYMETHRPISLGMLSILVLLIALDAALSFSIVFMGNDFGSIYTNTTLILFFFIKSLVAGSGVFMLATYHQIKRLREIPKRRLLYLLTLTYLGLLLYQITII